ncbi:mycofactocin-coupled SDR family oxidoreductase [Mycobacterium sp. NPDC003449]
MGRLDDKVVLITGAGMGQGRAHAVRLAQEGAKIIALDIARPFEDGAPAQFPPAMADDLETTRELVEKAGGACLTVAADVRNRAEVQAAVDGGLDEFGRIDVVCANAGAWTIARHSWEVTNEQFDFVVETNLRGVWNTLVCAIPAMIEAKRGGSIILTSSAAGIRGQFPYAHYTASKHGVVGLMRAFANELGPHRIRVNTVHPTGVNTEGMGRRGFALAAPIFAADDRAMAGAVNVLPDLDTEPDTPWAPVGSLQPVEISHAVLFLASDESRYITGVQLPVDAGNTNKP